MDITNKYLTEAKIKLNDNDIKKLITNKKSGKYELNKKMIKVSVVDNTMILEYPSDMLDFTYKLTNVCDDLKYSYTQIGIDNKKDMKFIIDMS